MKNNIILASNSEIRRKLLRKAGVHFKAVKSNFDETQLQNRYKNQECSLRDAKILAKKLSYEKAKIISDKGSNLLVIGCDQILLFDKKVLNKPNSFEESFKQMKDLSGKKHILITATSCVKESKEIWYYISIQKMCMRKLSDDYIKKYIDQIGNNVLNILGGYEIEGKGINLFESIGDDLFSIQGIPILQLTNFLRQAEFIE
tara:strand:+ start:108 stop:713 length:606 start_codon:yes stop_codon:yes gene_type:complete